MMFGMIEEEGEDLVEKVSEVLGELGEKPQIEAERVGRLTKPLKSSAAVDHAWARPVKVSFESTSRVVASRILTLSRNLKQSAQFNKFEVVHLARLDTRAAATTQGSCGEIAREAGCRSRPQIFYQGSLGTQ